MIPKGLPKVSKRGHIYLVVKLKWLFVLELMGPEGRLCKYGAIIAVASFALCEAISSNVK